MELAATARIGLRDGLGLSLEPFRDSAHRLPIFHVQQNPPRYKHAAHHTKASGHQSDHRSFAMHHLYLRIAQRVFAKPVSLGGRAVGWPAGEVAALNAARISGKSDSEIRQLVVQLQAVRKTAA